jgi:methionyl-tRNA formyltransferase
MEAGLDTGDVVMAASAQITDATTSRELSDALAKIGAKLMVRAMHDLERHQLTFTRQNNVDMSYATKIENTETRIDWNMPAQKVLRHIHGLSPSPGAWCEMPIRGQISRVKILRCELANGVGRPGELLDDQLAIACGQGAIRVLEVQPSGKGPMSARAFLSGAALKPPFFLS